MHVAVNTQINRLSLPDLGDELETVIAAGGKSWQIQLTVAMGRAADEPDILTQPYDLLELFPTPGSDLEEAQGRSAGQPPRRNNVGYFGPYEGLLRGSTARDTSELASVGRNSIGIEADGTIMGCLSLSGVDGAPGPAATSAIALASAEIWKRADAPAVHA